MKISVIGLGYVGLPLAAAISIKTKYEIVGFDINAANVKKIKNRICPIDDEQCAKDLKVIKFNVSFDKSILNNSDIFIICVPTPVLDDYTPDLEPVKNATLSVADFIKKGNMVVIESTVNPGVCEEVVKPILEKKSGLKAGIDFDIAHCPERINPGDPKWNVYNIPRNIGSTRKESTKILADFYRSFISAEINEMPDLKTAEATKIIENTFRDINIAYVNELAKSFDVLGIDLLTVIKGASNKPFAFMPHFPGCGVGGHCIPVDPYYLIERAKKSGFDHKYLKLAREINNSMPEYTVDLLIEALNKQEKPLKKTKVGLLGLAYKSNISDLRESPALKIKKLLEKHQADLLIFDPFYTEMNNVETLDELLNSAYAIVVATDHSQFKKITAEDLKKTKVEIVIDGKNCLNKEDIINKGIYYKGIGR